MISRRATAISTHFAALAAAFTDWTVRAAGSRATGRRSLGVAVMNRARLPFSDKSRAAVAELASGRSQQTVGCSPIPLPMVSMLAMLRTFDVRDDRVVMKIDSDGSDCNTHDFLDFAEHPANVEPSLFGHSIGRWDGETLMIDTVAFTPHGIGLGFSVPSGTGKHLIERLDVDRRSLAAALRAHGRGSRVPHTTPATYTAMWDHRPDLAPGSACDPENRSAFGRNRSRVVRTRPRCVDRANGLSRNGAKSTKLRGMKPPLDASLRAAFTRRHTTEHKNDRRTSGPDDPLTLHGVLGIPLSARGRGVRCCGCTGRRAAACNGSCRQDRHECRCAA